MLDVRAGWRGAGIIAALLTITALLEAGDPVRGERLFRITRNKNDNVICYDVLLKGGKLDVRNPVSVYWIIPSQNNKLEGLNRIERNKAYGVTVVKAYGQDSVDIQLSAAKKPLRVTVRGGAWVALIPLEGSEAAIDSVSVMADESGVMPTVKWVDVLGRNPVNGVPLKTRITK